MSGNAVIGQSGGPTAVINQSLVGAIEALTAAQHQGRIGKILGAKHGVRGVIQNEFVSLDGLSKDLLERVAATPSSALGSTRDKPDEAYCRKIFESFKKNNVSHFFYIGGNDSADTARITAEMAAADGVNLRVYHVPKTIDNDLRTTDHCPGYGSAARFVALAHQGDDADNRSLKGIKINIVMGRDAGWLTAASALGRWDESDGPHLIYVPEVDFNEDRFIGDVDRVYTKLGRCVIAVSEGVRYAAGDKKSLLAEKIMTGGEVDAHGNRQLSGSGALGDYLANLVKSKLGKLVASRTPAPGAAGGAGGGGVKLRVRSDTFGYLQRSFPTIVSESDAAEARECGRRAVAYALDAPEGLASGSVAMRRTSDLPYAIDYFPTPLDTVARQTKPLPVEWVANGCALSEQYLRYARPLAGALPKPGRLI
ncbi:MAG TPA: 6-phosphofructokinase [Chthoniobacteraceae bacterium]|nr:6-phosphofructokinase [Phycisphaerae bacterium]HWB58911.1 6-phosphofructokinase [Chthoniobacteraceae bacterium]